MYGQINNPFLKPSPFSGITGTLYNKNSYEQSSEIYAESYRPTNTGNYNDFN